MRSLLRLIRFTNELRGLYLIIIVCSMAAAIGTLAVPFIIGAATDVIVDVVNGRVALADGLVATMWFAVAFWSLSWPSRSSLRSGDGLVT